MTIIEFLETKWHVGMKVRILSGAHKGNTYNVVAPDFDQCLIGCLCNPDDNVETDIVYFRCENCKLFPDMTPESEPKRVKITITPIEE